MARPRDPLDRPIKAQKRIPFDFVLDALETLGPETRPMFGCTAVYVGDRIVFILRDKGKDDADSGVWFAYQPDREAEVLALYPSLARISIFGDKVQGWRRISSRSPDFEEAVLDACARVRAGDERLGKVPGAKKPKRASAPKPAAPKKPPAKKASAKKAPAKKAPAKKAARAQRPK